jgi:hypothetical protein
VLKGADGNLSRLFSIRFPRFTVPVFRPASTVRERTKKQIQNEMNLAADCPAGGLFPELIAEPPQNLKAP